MSPVKVESKPDTMPDPDTGQQGTGVVDIIALNVDANHDGTMDFSFTGPYRIQDAILRNDLRQVNGYIESSLNEGMHSFDQYLLDTSIATVALPYIAGNLGATQDEATWVLTSYLFGLFGTVLYALITLQKSPLTFNRCFRHSSHKYDRYENSRQRCYA